MEDEHDRLADQLEEDASSIERQSSELREDIKDTRDDWDQKTKAEGVPGAMEIDEDPVAEVENQPNTFEYEERTAPSPPDGDESDDGSDDS